MNPMFIAALFKIGKIWKHPKYPPMGEWIRKIWCIYTVEFYSVIKKRTNLAICDIMDGPQGHYTK